MTNPTPSEEQQRQQDFERYIRENFSDVLSALADE